MGKLRLSKGDDTEVSELSGSREPKEDNSLWIDCIAHQFESARRGCWTRSTDCRSSAHYEWRISIWLTCLLGAPDIGSVCCAFQSPGDPMDLRRASNCTLPAFARSTNRHKTTSRRAQRESERLRTLRDLDASALRLREICLITLDPAILQLPTRSPGGHGLSE
jgi:hypothetical protein